MPASLSLDFVTSLQNGIPSEWNPVQCVLFCFDLFLCLVCLCIYFFSIFFIKEIIIKVIIEIIFEVFQIIRCEIQIYCICDACYCRNSSNDRKSPENCSWKFLFLFFLLFSYGSSGGDFRKSFALIIAAMSSTFNLFMLIPPFLYLICNGSAPYRFVISRSFISCLYIV